MAGQFGDVLSSIGGFASKLSGGQGQNMQLSGGDQSGPLARIGSIANTLSQSINGVGQDSVMDRSKLELMSREQLIDIILGGSNG